MSGLSSHPPGTFPKIGRPAESPQRNVSGSPVAGAAAPSQLHVRRVAGRSKNVPCVKHATQSIEVQSPVALSAG